MKNPRVPQRVVEMAAKMGKLIRFVFVTHAEKPRQLRNATRLWDNRTPFGVHPCWCAMCILQETTLPEEIRQNGYQALLLHDVLEDTTGDLPEETTPEVRKLVDDMTFEGIDQEREQVWSKGKEVILLKLYDKCSNLLEGRTMYPNRRVLYLAYIRKLVADVRKNYGELNIVAIAESLCDKYESNKKLEAARQWITLTNERFEALDSKLQALLDKTDHSLGDDLEEAIDEIRRETQKLYSNQLGIDDATWIKAIEEALP